MGKLSVAECQRGPLGVLRCPNELLEASDKCEMLSALQALTHVLGSGPNFSLAGTDADAATTPRINIMDMAEWLLVTTEILQAPPPLMVDRAPM